MWYEYTIDTLKEMLGAHVKYKPMYPNFPKQVIEMEEAELYWNATLHYLTAWASDIIGDTFIYLPEYDKITREPLKTTKKLKVIDLGTEEDFRSIFTKLCAINTSLSEIDKKILKWFLTNYDNLKLPDVIPQKETVAILAANGYGHLLKTATDVLRMIVITNEGDVSLAKPTKFKIMKRGQRRTILNYLNNMNEITEDMLRYKEVWKRLAKVLYPRDYKKQYSKAYKAFEVVCNNLPFETYNSKLERLIKNKELISAIKLLKLRPGIYARRLDQLCRLNINFEDHFIEVADQVSTPVLLQAWHHFNYRDKQRVFFPKGNTAKMQIPDKNLEPLDTSVLADKIRGVLINRFKKLSPIYNPSIDYHLKTQIIPFAARSTSKALHTIGRGSRVSIENGNLLRAFIWWKNIGSQRVDIDLSVVFYDNSFESLGHVSYRNLRYQGITHSGDITNAPNGACEFIDVEIDKLLGRNIRFIIMSVNSFTGQKFDTLPECFAGWMIRSNDSGEIFEAKTVENKFNLMAQSTISIPIIIDLLQHEIIWLDLALTSKNWINNVSSSGKNLQKILKVMVDLNRPNLFDLFNMHIEAREVIATNQEKTIFSLKEVSDLSEYLQ
jgi:hypothetical protein